MKLLRTAALILALVLVGLLAIVGLLLLTRQPPGGTVRAFGELDGPPAVGTPAFARTLGHYTDVMLRTGHDVDILLDGDGTFPVLWRDLRAARRSITFQPYYAEPGALADSLLVLLRERARAGVSVRFLYDAFGSGPLEDGWLDSLRAAGVGVAEFRPVRWYTLHKAADRSHSRAVVIDGRIGYSGGFGIADQWLGDGVRRGWRETNVRFTGPAVGALQGAFASAWAEATGELIVGDLWFPEASDSAGGVVAALMDAVPSLGVSPASWLLALSFEGARRTLYITNSYFVPDATMRDQLLRAARRGVDVRLLLPSDRTDVPITRRAARAGYERLLRGGVRIWEYQPQMVHAKTFVADGVFAQIGSLNLDAHSLSFNTESALLVQDTLIAARLDSIFLDDIARSTEIELTAFLQRSWTERVREWFAARVARFL